MKLGVKKVLKYAGVLLALAVFVPAAYVGYLYITYINTTIVSGSGYGFTIGQSKEQAYEAAKRAFEAGNLAGINTVQDRNEELLLNPWLEADLPVKDAVDRIEGWDTWSLSLNTSSDRPSLLGVVVFEGDYVSSVGQPGKLSSRWNPPEYPALDIHKGQTRAQVAVVFQALSQSPGYESLRLSTGWMARRQPKTFAQAEFRYVEGNDDWTLLVDQKWSYFNTVRLRFHDGALAEIHRHRQYFELP